MKQLLKNRMRILIIVLVVLIIGYLLYNIVSNKEDFPFSWARSSVRSVVGGYSASTKACHTRNAGSIRQR